MWNQSTDFSQNRKKQTKKAISIQDCATQRARLSNQAGPSRVFAIGGALAGLAGILGGMYFSAISPGQGGSLLIFAFIVVVIGGLGSVTGSALAAVAVGLLQQFVNYYGTAGAGDVSVVVLLAVVLLLRPAGIAGKVATA